MKDQVILGPKGDLAIAVPLYRILEEENLEKLEGYSLQLTDIKPVAYAVDLGNGTIPLLNANIVEKQCEFLGDL